MLGNLTSKLENALGVDIDGDGRVGNKPPGQAGYGQPGSQQQNYNNPPYHNPPGGGYPPQSNTGYPPQGNSAYPPPGGTGYPPAGNSAYPPPGNTGYPPPNNNAYPPPSNTGYPPPGNTGYPPPNNNAYPPPGNTGPPPPGNTGYPPQNNTGYPPPGNTGYPPQNPPVGPQGNNSAYPQGNTGYPPQANNPGYPPQANNPGYPPQANNPGYPPQANNPGYPPQANTPGYPPAPGGYPLAAGGGFQPGVQGYDPLIPQGPTGTKRALLIGINYYGTGSELKGCVNDVSTMRDFLQHHGFQQQNMHILVDDRSWNTQPPTRANITQEFQWLSQGAQPGDILFLHYSGHGTQTRDLDGDEADGYDEALVPLDHQSAGVITDDEVFDRVCARLPQRCRLTAVMDCCHSGTVMDLPYTFKANKANMANIFVNGKFNAAGLPQMLMSQKWDLTNKKKMKKQAMQLGMQLLGSAFGGGGGAGGKGGGGGQGYQQQGSKFVAAEVIMFSGCADGQTSADVANVSQFGMAPGPGGAGGACTNAMISVLQQKPQITIIELLEEMRKILERKGFKQVPQLSTSRPIDMGQPFTFGLLNH